MNKTVRKKSDIMLPTWFQSVFSSSLQLHRIQKCFTKLDLFHLFLAPYFTVSKRHLGNRTLPSSSVINIRKINIWLHKIQLHKVKTVQLSESKTQRQHGASQAPKSSGKLWVTQFQFKKTNRQNSYISDFHVSYVSVTERIFIYNVQQKQNVFLWVTTSKQH